jgi:hypothetical protein
MPRQSTNLYTETPGQYVYLYKNGRYGAFKRFPHDSPPKGNHIDKHYWQKGALFYSFEDAKEWLKSLPDKMDRPYRYDSHAPVEHSSSN